MIYQKLQDIYNELEVRRYDDLTDYEKGLKDVLNFIDPSNSGNDQDEMFIDIIRAIQKNNIKSKAYSNKSAKSFLDYELKDDHTETGGTAHPGETLREFLEEVNEPLDSPMHKVNEWLIECGIMPII